MKSPLSNKSVISTVLFLFLCLSCGNEKHAAYYEALALIDEKVDYDYVLFIPYRGCGGCVGTTINFLKKNSSSDVLKIFYDYNSLKDLKIRMGEDLNKDTLIDMEEKYFKILGPTLYPAIIDIRNNTKGDVEILDPFKSQTFWNEFKNRIPR